MSSPKLNLPMLNPYLLGEIISSHDGVSCYPAIRRGTDEKYIVKVISIPASQSKVDALLLAGALADKDAALDYFMTLSKDLLNQTDILRNLSQQEGFVPYLEGQIMPMEGDVGYHVYLLGSYKQSLERIFRTDVMTHADVTNLGLDLCAALAACRRTGYLYVDLKPGNIFRDPEQGFRIGDVGFIALSSLKYASLPVKYRSSYTAPELTDDMAVVNTTADIYALGLVLYQAYNGGVLPFEGAAPAQILPPPIYADYEMAEIILKACHPDPKQRWQEPTKMAHALIEYLQTYGAPETPIIPPVMEHNDAEEEVPEEEPFLPEADPQELQQEMDDLENADPDELAFLSGLVSDETAPSEENTADVPDAVMTEELSEMFAQADELISHALPEPPVAPDPIFAPMPSPIVLEDAQEPAAEEVAQEAEPVEEMVETVSEPATEELEAAQETPIPAETEIPVPLEKKEKPVKVKKSAAAPTPASKKKAQGKDDTKPAYTFHWKIAVAAVAMLLLMIGCFLVKDYFDNQYLLQVDDLVLTYENDTLTVQVISQIDDSLLSVSCTDSYGNSLTSPVVNGIATFTNLKPGTYYTVKVEVSGHHELAGTIYDNLATPAQTQIHSFTASIGPQDCSVALNFTVIGPETGNWIVVCSAEGVEEKRVAFTGRSVVVTGLVEGAHYTFTLTSPDELYIAGKTQTDFLVTKILFAQDLEITNCGGGSLTAQWKQPEGYTVKEWQVRCYNESGYNVTVTTSDLSYTFTELDHSSRCTVEVTAVGMNQSVSTSISADPVTITDFQCDATTTGILVVNWSYESMNVVESWVLHYSVNGTVYSVALTDATTCLNISASGSYQFFIQAAAGQDVLNRTHSFEVEAPALFEGYGIGVADLNVMPVLVPDGATPNLNDFGADDYRTAFATGEQAGTLLTANLRPVDSEDLVLVDVMIYDENGQIVSHTSKEMLWKDMWSGSKCLICATQLPENPGAYTLQIFFNGAFVCQQDITIQAPIADEPAQ